MNSAHVTVHDIVRAVARAIAPLQAQRMIDGLRSVRPGFAFAEKRRQSLERALSIFDFAVFACRHSLWYDALRALDAAEKMCTDGDLWWRPDTTIDGKGCRDAIWQIRRRLERYFEDVASREMERRRRQHPWRYGRSPC